MRVVIIGPVSPFRSGIARHTSAIARELAKRPRVALSVISFKRQYPALLYKGESDADVDARPPEGIDVAFMIDSLNPFTWAAAARHALSQKPDIAVIPAWTFFLAPCLGWIARALRRRGVPVAMIVHNAEDHEARGWKRMLSRFQLRQATRLITHNAATAGATERLCPDTPIEICPHPVYDDYPAATGTLARGAALELLFFGLIRSYKGLDVALHALAKAGLRDARLAVVGEFWEGRPQIETLIRDLGLSAGVELVPRFVSDQEAAEYFHRCDAVIAPYRSASASGVVALAHWYGRPVIASDTPGLAEAVEDGVTGWLFPNGDVPALAELLKTRVSRETAENMRPAIAAVIAERNWGRFADTILASSRSAERPARRVTKSLP